MKRPTWEVANALGLEVYDRWAASDPPPRTPRVDGALSEAAPGLDGRYRGPRSREAFTGKAGGLVDGEPYSGVTLTVRAHGPARSLLDRLGHASYPLKGRR